MTAKAGKRLMVLGGSSAQLPLLKSARAMGCELVVCDQNPGCPGREYAATFHAVSTADGDGLLAVARSEAIDGITTYASDPSAQAVAYVGNALGLPSNPYGAVTIMTHKEMFRRFLSEHGFMTPKAEAADDWAVLFEKSQDIDGAVIVKPSDSSGSRGITQIPAGRRNAASVQAAFELARLYGNSDIVVLEEFFDRTGYQVAGDGFLVDGQLVFRCFANEHFHPAFNPLVPVGESIPSVWPSENQERAHDLLQAILDKLGMRIGALNFDFFYLQDGRPLVIEIGPRNGGNLIPEITKLATGIDMIKATAQVALGEKPDAMAMQEPKGFYASHVLHVKQKGIFKALSLDPDLRRNIVEQRIYVEAGTRFSAQDVGNCRLAGSLILKFDTMDCMLATMDGIDRQVRLIME